MNPIKAIVFVKNATGNAIKPQDVASMTCLPLQWSMNTYFFQPLGCVEHVSWERRLNQSPAYHIAVANVYNYVMGYVNETALQCQRFVPPKKTPWFEEAYKTIKDRIDRCANRKLAQDKTVRIVPLSELSYHPDNVHFLSRLYDVVTTYPFQYGRDLLSAIVSWRDDDDANSNLSFLIYLYQLVGIYKNFQKIKILYDASPLPPPKCYGPNNAYRPAFDQTSTVSICSVCYVVSNLYICKAYDRAKIYNDPLVPSLMYTCKEKTSKQRVIRLIYKARNGRVYYPKITHHINKTTRYEISMDTSSRVSNRLNLYKIDKRGITKLPWHHIVQKDASHRCTNPVDMCEGCETIRAALRT